MKHPFPQPVLLALAILAVGCSPARPMPTTTMEPTQPPSPRPSPTTMEPTPPPSPRPSPTEALPTATSEPTLTPTPYPVFWDDFTGDLQPGWMWIRENDALWSLTSEPGFLRIVLQGGLYPRNLLVRDVASDNFQITTHVLFTPTSNFQFAGLLVYQDDGTRAELGRAYCNLQDQCVGNGIYLDAFQDGQFKGENFAIDTQLKDEAYLRLDKVGSTLTGYYSEDGANWYPIGAHDLSMTDPKVGLMAGQSYVVGAVALFDYFSVMEMP